MRLNFVRFDKVTREKQFRDAAAYASHLGQDRVLTLAVEPDAVTVWYWEVA